MSITEINKLKEKVDKDPNSRLYVPLAEEYRKEGMMDEAIEVLQKGLGLHPGYMSARVALGKIYHAKGQMDEARIEFESVVKSIPDNLYAHKKLAEIYRDTGKRDLAIKALRTVLKLNPMDEETLNSLRDLEGVSNEQPPEKQQEPGSPSEAMFLEQSTHDQLTEGPSLEPLVQNVESAEEILAVEEEVSADAEELPEEAGEEWSFGDVETAPGIEAVEEEIIAETIEAPEEADEGLFFGDMADVLRAEELKAAGEVEEAPEDIFTPIKDKSLTGVTAGIASGADFGSQKDKGLLLQTADRFISEEKYLGAINIYQQILAADTDDKQTLQRIEELRSLLKLMGKDKEVLMSKLNAFLGAIKKRGDEFHRSS
jgi:tetratricopeptide (TPR) repeat protein